jgi:hypothetical protein
MIVGMGYAIRVFGMFRLGHEAPSGLLLLHRWRNLALDCVETPPVRTNLLMAVCGEFAGELFRGGGGCDGAAALGAPLPHQPGYPYEEREGIVSYAIVPLWWLM